MNSLTSNIKNFFIPKYDELTLYLYAASYLFLLVTDADFRSFFLQIAAEHSKAIVVELFVVYGAILSIVHVFLKRKKTNAQKFAMLTFIIISNLLVALYAIMQLTKNGGSMVTIHSIPLAFNLIFSVILLISWKYDLVDESNVADEDAPFLHVVLVTIPLLLSFLCGQFYFNAPWYLSYSWTVFLSLTAKEVVVFFLPRSAFISGSHTS